MIAKKSFSIEGYGWLPMNVATNQPCSDYHRAFVLSIAEDEEFGWHVEFEG